tara:strand:- start:325 stop:657 length:333 start_codon:yes stop_codon:yes gene_type:complete
MNIVRINGKKTKIAAPQVRSLELLQRNNFITARSEFWEGSNRHLSFALDIDSTWGVAEVFRRSALALAHGVPDHPAKVRRFFRRNPRCRTAIVGNPRRINSILRQISREG